MARVIPERVRHLPPFLQAKLAEDCRGDWRRVTVDVNGSVTLHNKPQVEPEPPPEPPAPDPEAPPEPPEIKRVELEPVRPRREAWTPPEPTGNGLRARGERAALRERAESAPLVDAETLAKLRGLLRPVPRPSAPEVPENEETGGAKTWLKEGKTDKFRRGMYKGDATALCAAITEHGFQGAIRCTEDILALGGLPWEDVIAAVRNPKRVEIRPESAKKKYPVLGLIRGDIQVVMGFLLRDSPAVIYCYWTHLLGHDQGQFNKGAAGSGGAKRAIGLPNTPVRVVQRLQEIGIEIPDVETSTENTAECLYRGQSLGRITIGNIYKKGQPETDYQRMRRKVEAINRRASAPAR